MSAPRLTNAKTTQISDYEPIARPRPHPSRAAHLHDLKEIAIPDTILLKPGRLAEEEFEIMKTHTTIGAEILSAARSPLL